MVYTASASEESSRVEGGIVSHCVALRAACGAEPGLEKTLGVATCEELCLSPDCTEGEIKVCLFC